MINTNKLVLFNLQILQYYILLRTVQLVIFTYYLSTFYDYNNNNNNNNNNFISLP